MTSRRIHLASLIPVTILAVTLGYHPVYWFALILGVLLPEIDTINPWFHRSWIFHTFLPPSFFYQISIQSSLYESFPTVIIVIHFITIGMLFHFLFDYVYPQQQTHDGAEWPVRPTIFSDPWGLMWLGLSWFVQWFSYLSIAFIPWVIGF